MSTRSLANLSSVCIRKDFTIRDYVQEQISRSLHIKLEEMKERIMPEDIEPIVQLLESLEITFHLRPPQIDLLVKAFAKSCDEMYIHNISKLYLAVSRVIPLYLNSDQPACFQEYELLKHNIVQKLLSVRKDPLSKDVVTLSDVLTLSLPMSADGISGDSPVWNLFKDIIYSNQSLLTFSDWAMVSR